jgi:hypothetical protein
MISSRYAEPGTCMHELDGIQNETNFVKLGRGGAAPRESRRYASYLHGPSERG